MIFKSGRGGKRKGAGRPKGTTIEHPRMTFGTRLPDWMVERLKAEPIPASRIIEEALLKYWGIKKTKGDKYG